MISIHSNSSCLQAEDSAAGVRPGARRAILRPKRFSRPVKNSGAPIGQISVLSQRSIRWFKQFSDSETGANGKHTDRHSHIDR
jgi:hypothetical protein